MNTQNTSLLLTSPASTEVSALAHEENYLIEPEANLTEDFSQQAYSFESMLQGQIKDQTILDDGNNLLINNEESPIIQASQETILLDKSLVNNSIIETEAEINNQPLAQISAQATSIGTERQNLLSTRNNSRNDLKPFIQASQETAFFDKSAVNNNIIESEAEINNQPLASVNTQVQSLETLPLTPSLSNAPNNPIMAIAKNSYHVNRQPLAQISVQTKSIETERRNLPSNRNDSSHELASLIQTAQQKVPSKPVSSIDTEKATLKTQNDNNPIKKPVSITLEAPVKGMETQVQTFPVQRQKVNEQNIAINRQILNNFPLAGSLAALSDEAMQHRDLTHDTKAFSAKSEQAQVSGNTIPTDGKKLPGKLPFLNNQSESLSSGQNIIEFNNKAIAQSQHFFQQANDSQTTLPQNIPQAVQTVQTESPTPTFNIAGLANLDKLIKSPSATSINTTNTSSFTIEAPFGSSDWRNQVGNRIRWMSNVNISTAELKLHPAELGTIEIKIATEDDQTKVSFLTNNAVTKDLLESSLPKLKDLLHNSGLQLEQSDVSQRNLSENKRFHEETNNEDSHKNDQDSIKEDSPIRPLRQSSLKQVDHYV